MQTSGLPTRIPVPFADSGVKNSIPITASPTPGLASFTTGFGPLNMTPIVAGGIPPEGQDFNGILNAITNVLRWTNAGGQYAYDATFSAAVGGYPKGALIARAGYDGYWQNTAENNTTNPDTGGAGWKPVPVQGGEAAIDTGTANAYSCVYSPAIVARSEQQVLRFKVKTANTGASTFNDGLGAVALVGGAQSALQGGELIANGDAWAQWNTSIGGGAYILLFCTGAAEQVAPASQSQHAVNAGQIQTQALTAFTTTGTAPAFVLTPAPAIIAYVAGQRFRVKLHAASAGSDTINISGLGAKNIKQYDSGGNKVAVILAAGQLADVEYDGVDVVVLDPLPAGQATETVTGILKIGTQALVNAGVDDTTSVTPKKMKNGFLFAVAVNGYMVLPSWMGGWGIQWGVVASLASGTPLTLSLPIAFANSTLWCLAGGSDSSNLNALACNAAPINNATIRLAQSYGSTMAARYFAIGN